MLFPLVKYAVLLKKLWFFFFVYDTLYMCTYEYRTQTRISTYTILQTYNLIILKKKYQLKRKIAKLTVLFLFRTLNIDSHKITVLVLIYWTILINHINFLLSRFRSQLLIPVFVLYSIAAIYHNYYLNTFENDFENSASGRSTTRSVTFFGRSAQYYYVSRFENDSAVYHIVRLLERFVRTVTGIGITCYGMLWCRRLKRLDFPVSATYGGRRVVAPLARYEWIHIDCSGVSEFANLT